MSSSTERLRLYGQDSEHPALDWSWVEGELAAAGTYWVVARSHGHPHPRPVWGVWARQRLFLSIGTPAIVRQLSADPVVTVHLDSGTQVVIVEGRAGATTEDRDVLVMYERKYDRPYNPATFGPLTVVVPTVVLAWRTAGWAGRDSFQETGRWGLS